MMSRPEIKTLSELPEGWIWTTVGEVTEINQGCGFPTRLQGKKRGDVPFYKVMDISKTVKAGNRYLETADNYISNEEMRKLGARTLLKDSIVFAKTGAAIHLNRRAILTRNSLIDNNVMGLHAIESVLHPLYAFYFMHTIKLGNLSRATTVPAIRKTDVESISLPLAPLKEQSRIVSKIEELFTKLDAGIEALKNAREQLKRFKQSVLSTAFRGMLVSHYGISKDVGAISDDVARVSSSDAADHRCSKVKTTEIDELHNLHDLPRGWQWCRLVDFCCLQVGFPFKSQDFASNGTKLLRGANIKPGSVYWTDTVYSRSTQFKDYMLEAGDVVIAMDRPVVSTGIKIAKVTASDVPSLLVQRVGRFISHQASMDYIYYLLSQQSCANHLVSLQTGSDLPHVSATHIMSYVVPLAPLQEQYRIVREIERHISVIEDTNNEIENDLLKARVMRHSILRSAFEGKLGPQDPTDQHASILLESMQRQKENRQKFIARKTIRGYRKK